MKKAKKIIIIILIILCSVGNMKNVTARGNLISTKETGKNISPRGNKHTPSKGNASTKTPTDGEEITNADGSSSCIREYCNVNRYYSITSDVYVYMYDMNGNEIENVLDPQVSFLAGTYVGFNIYEKNTFYSWATYSYSYYKKVYSCTHTDRYCINSTPSGKCLNWDTNTSHYTQDCKCNAGDTGTWSWQSDSGDEASCAAHAQPYSYTINSQSYNITYNDSNDIETTMASEERYNTMGSSLKEDCDEDYEEENIIDEDATLNKSEGEKCETQYNRKDACINVKNGKVTYKMNKNGDCNEDEYKVLAEYDENGNFKYWKYFIPLNANSKNGFAIYLNGKDVRSSGLCQDIIENYDNYRDLLAKPDGSKLSNNKARAIEQVSDGCIYQSVINIPIIQRFYNELKNGETFKGFNFYYKPIDIDNTFPNGLTETSLWYDWNESNDKNPDLTESYDDITYIATNINPDAIRNFNKDNPYTSWTNMNINGTSNLITDNGQEIRNAFIVRSENVNTDNIYPLGCGPLNTKVTNTFKQVECDKK